LALLNNTFSAKTPYESPWKYIYSVLVYAAAIPGIFSLTISAYTFFFERTSFLKVNLYVYFIPIVAMFITFGIIRQKVRLIDLPWFRRLSGLLLVLITTFVVMLIIQKTRIWFVFHGSIGTIGILFLILFVVFMLGWHWLAPKPAERNQVQ